ncbi:uncharacterized protein LOC133327683 [Musca vetustissima]|uniref:uncharacterized protein LOC133327683 n=1 Tax=Musca vetustissima TaxID=27455 RepID=UPI002AB71FC4|nr:uncharacterized protein LOC133327683 [Musca vetustissima]
MTLVLSWLASWLNGRLADGHTEANVQLIVPRYVERGTSATLECLHDVDPSVLFKVSWFREEMKFFEYVSGRKPPFKNFTLEGATIDRENSNASQVTLANVDFKLSGQFHCEVSMTSPLYTKASGEHLMSVFLPQTGNPVIRFRKRSPVAVGERLMVLCNTTRARPPPHITWLINNQKVDDKYIRTHHVYSISGKTHRRPPPEQDFDILQAKQKKQQQQQHRHHIRGISIYNNPFSPLVVMHDIDLDDYEIQQQHHTNSHYDNKHHIEVMKKHFDGKKHR